MAILLEGAGVQPSTSRWLCDPIRPLIRPLRRRISPVTICKSSYLRLFSSQNFHSTHSISRHDKCSAKVRLYPQIHYAGTYILPQPQSNVKRNFRGKEKDLHLCQEGNSSPPNYSLSSTSPLQFRSSRRLENTKTAFQ